MKDDRATLVDALGGCMDRILERLAEEATRSSTLDPSPTPETIAGYREWMRAFVPTALEAVAARDEERQAILKRLPHVAPPAQLDPVPPVARRGLFALGFRLAHQEVAAYARTHGLDHRALARELDLFGGAAAIALAGRSIGVA
jgi:hypothetical protein